MTPRSTSRVDLHPHADASAGPRLGVRRALGLPECATPPQEVYDLARRRGMNVVRITDHDTMGALVDGYVGDLVPANARLEASNAREAAA